MLWAIGRIVMPMDAMLHDRAAELVDRLAAADAPDMDETIALKRVEGLPMAIRAAAADRDQAVRLAALELIADLGRPVVPEDEAADLPERLAPYIADPPAVAALVEALDDPDPDVRGAAATAMALGALDLTVRNFTPQILAAAERFPTTDGMALLLGKTGAEAARRMLHENEVLAGVSDEETRAARARLGDRAAEQSLIEDYAGATEPEDVARPALRLGYVATLRAVLTLARDMRTAASYAWRGDARRSVRVHLIEALHIALPEAEPLWPPFYRPEGDEYYETVERWITQNLGVTWVQPRPDFLWQHDAPVVR